jgi:hypothetical protein
MLKFVFILPLLAFANNDSSKVSEYLSLMPIDSAVAIIELGSIESSNADLDTLLFNYNDELDPGVQSNVIVSFDPSFKDSIYIAFRSRYVYHCLDNLKSYYGWGDVSKRRLNRVSKRLGIKELSEYRSLIDELY